ncbi:hypothetical protein BU17DRAFT_86763 [Hysterangium stoloniferum]|nr:hypothetical protein BU17DRAFT_86763 [Hysterangium stoloniferum]
MATDTPTTTLLTTQLLLRVGAAVIQVLDLLSAGGFAGHEAGHIGAAAGERHTPTHPNAGEYPVPQRRLSFATWSTQQAPRCARALSKPKISRRNSAIGRLLKWHFGFGYRLWLPSRLPDVTDFPQESEIA